MILLSLLLKWSISHQLYDGHMLYSIQFMTKKKESNTMENDLVFLTFGKNNNEHRTKVVFPLNDQTIEEILCLSVCFLSFFSFSSNSSMGWNGTAKEWIIEFNKNIHIQNDSCILFRLTKSHSRIQTHY